MLNYKIIFRFIIRMTYHFTIVKFITKIFWKKKTIPCNFYEVHDWLANLAKNAPYDQCLDIFLEIPYRITESQLGGNPLEYYSDGIDAITDELNECMLTDNQRIRKCQQLRFHYIDLRNYYTYMAALNWPPDMIVHLIY